jgi:hypothetical protein
VNLVLKHAGGANLVVRPQVRPAWYPAARSRPVQVEVWWRYEGEPPAAARLIGTFAPGQAVSYPLNPLVDRNIILSTVSISAAGLRSVRDIADAHETMLVFQRETEAPTVALVGNATHTLLTLAVDGFSTLAIKRRVRVADDVDMATGLVEAETEVSPGNTLPRVIYLNRTDSNPHTRTVYVAVSHSSGGDYGAESGPDAFTYADVDETGGDDGDGDPFGGKDYDV